VCDSSETACPSNNNTENDHKCSDLMKLLRRIVLVQKALGTSSKGFSS
jgi:hypothetical protein